MKTKNIKVTISVLLLLGIYSCKKGEVSGIESQSYARVDSSDFVTSDSISSVATMKVEDKQFIKTANVNMEVADVYEATIYVEESTKELGGFVTHSDLKSSVVSEDTYNVSDEEAKLIKKYQTENTIRLKISTEKLGLLLTKINDKKLFLNSRLIHAEDVTSSIKYAHLEGKRIKKTSENISQMKKNKDKVTLDNENMLESNQQQLANLDMTDQLKFSTVDVYIREPKIRIAEISVTNTKSIDNKYKFEFIYSVKSAFVEGYYLIQRVIVGLIVIWPFLLIGGVFFLLYRKKKNQKTDRV